MGHHASAIAKMCAHVFDNVGCNVSVSLPAIAGLHYHYVTFLPIPSNTFLTFLALTIIV